MAAILSSCGLQGLRAQRSSSSSGPRKCSAPKPIVKFVAPRIIPLRRTVVVPDAVAAPIAPAHPETTPARPTLYLLHCHLSHPTDTQQSLSQDQLQKLRDDLKRMEKVAKRAAWYSAVEAADGEHVLLLTECAKLARKYDLQRMPDDASGFTLELAGRSVTVPLGEVSAALMAQAAASSEEDSSDEDDEPMVAQAPMQGPQAVPAAVEDKAGKKQRKAEEKAAKKVRKEEEKAAKAKAKMAAKMEEGSDDEDDTDDEDAKKEKKADKSATMRDKEADKEGKKKRREEKAMVKADTKAEEEESSSEDESGSEEEEGMEMKCEAAARGPMGEKEGGEEEESSSSGSEEEESSDEEDMSMPAAGMPVGGAEATAMVAPAVAMEVESGSDSEGEESSSESDSGSDSEEEGPAVMGVDSHEPAAAS